MSSKEWIAKQQRKVDELLTLFPKAVQTSHTQTIKRIYEEGMLGDSGNKKYEYNDSDPLYINPLTSPGNVGKPQGKPKHKIDKQGRFRDKMGRFTKEKKGSFKKIRQGQGLEHERFFTLRDRKTKYFPSYKAYRRKIGREVGFVNLKLEGLQFRDNATSLTILSANRVAVGFKNKANSKKFEGQQKKYGNFHKPNEAEKKVLFEAIEDQRRRLAV